jgi:hypothetical protein
MWCKLGKRIGLFVASQVCSGGQDGRPLLDRGESGTSEFPKIEQAFSDLVGQLDPADGGAGIIKPLIDCCCGAVVSCCFPFVRKVS